MHEKILWALMWKISIIRTS